MQSQPRPHLSRPTERECADLTSSKRRGVFGHDDVPVAVGLKAVERSIRGRLARIVIGAIRPAPTSALCLVGHKVLIPTQEQAGFDVLRRRPVVRGVRRLTTHPSVIASLVSLLTLPCQQRCHSSTGSHNSALRVAVAFGTGGTAGWSSGRQSRNGSDEEGSQHGDDVYRRIRCTPCDTLKVSGL